MLRLVNNGCIEETCLMNEYEVIFIFTLFLLSSTLCTLSYDSFVFVLFCDLIC